MSKSIGIMLLGAVVLLGASGWIYQQRARRGEGTRGISEQRKSSSTALPSAPAVVPPGNSGLTESILKSVKAGEPSFAPRAGESLEFAANVTKLNSTIASLRIAVGEKQMLAGKAVWHFQAFAHTENPYRMIFELDDQFDSFSDPSSMASLQYEMHLNERGQKVDSVQRMLPSVREPAPPDAAAARVLPGTRDPLGMLQYLRAVDWGKSPEVRSPVYDGRKLYDVRATRIGKPVAISVPAGNFSASKIELRVFENDAELKDAHFMLYLTDNSTRTPVLLEAVLPIATARVELTKFN